MNAYVVLNSYCKSIQQMLSVLSKVTDQISDVSLMLRLATLNHSLGFHA